MKYTSALIEKTFPFSTFKYFGEALNKGPKWIFRVWDDGCEWDCFVYAVVTLGSVTHPENNRVEVTFAKFVRRAVGLK